MLSSGLVLAGANASGSDDAIDDGVLTAEEIATLDLRRTGWAVLSACDTGRGRVQDGEGVLGLRRAFEVAGVRTVITSLWKLDDRTAQEWMSELYRLRLDDGTSTIESVRRASRAMLAARRRAGLDTHPFHWGAFVAAGDWR